MAFTLLRKPNARIKLTSYSTRAQNNNNKLKSDAMNGLSCFAPTVILVRTFLDHNIGAAARAMLNFGLCDLRLVDPQCDHLSSDARARATGAVTVLEQAKVFKTMQEATCDLKSTFAASARLRDMTMKVVSPFEMSKRIVEISNNESDRSKPSCGIIFGPERSGLTNDDLRSVDALIQIKANPNFGSINLAQAVNICAHEYYNVSEENSSEGKSDLYLRDEDELATKGDVENLLSRVDGFTLTDQSNNENHNRRSAKLRSILGRLSISKSEVRVLHGILSSLTDQRTHPSSSPSKE